MDDSLRGREFSIGDVIKRESRNPKYYVISGFGVNGGNLAYRYARYDRFLFDRHDGSGWMKCEYLEKLVRSEEIGEWVNQDYQWEKVGRVTDGERRVETKEGLFEYDLEAMKTFNSKGFESIGEGQIFLEGVKGTRRIAEIIELGKGTSKLVSDMARVSYWGDDNSWVDHRDNIEEVIETGVWIPVREAEEGIKGAREITV